MKLSYAIKFVADMDKAVAFHRDLLGLTLKFQSPFWSEFATGDTTLALHPVTPDKQAGAVELGFQAEDLMRLYAGRDASRLTFTKAPEPEHGTLLARFLDSEGCECSISGGSR